MKRLFIILAFCGILFAQTTDNRIPLKPNIKTISRTSQKNMDVSTFGLAIIILSFISNGALVFYRGLRTDKKLDNISTQLSNTNSRLQRLEILTGNEKKE